jgi:hypothetical protein
MNILKGVIDKVASRKLAVTAAAGAAATGAVEITLPVAIVAAAYIIGQAFGRVFSTVDLLQ